MLVAFPGLILALFVAVAFGVGATGAVVALGVAGAPSLARLTHTLASSVAGTDYVAAARVLGVSRFRMLTRHILPNIAEPLVLNVTTAIGAALLAFSALSFLGLGVQPPFYDWGRMLNEGLGRIYVNPAGALAPGAAIVLAGLTFNLLGEGLAQVASGRPVSVVPRRASRHRRPACSVAVDDVPDDLVLDAGGLSVVFPSPGGDILAVRDVSLTVRRGEMVGIVGESGSGKTVTALAIAQLVSYPGEATFERFRFDGRDVLELPAGERRRLLATSLPVVFQNPGTSLNPASRVGRQLSEVSEVHASMSRAAATKRAADKLRQVAIAAPERRLRAYPHELSGGMKQRAVIAMGLMGKPKLFIADEPTTALDVTVQRQIFDVLRQVNRDEGASVLLISHDIAAVAELCSRIVVMYAGRIVEEADVATVVERSRRSSVHASARRGGPRHDRRPRPSAGDDSGTAARSPRCRSRVCVRPPLSARRRPLSRRATAARLRSSTAGGSPAGTRRRPRGDVRPGGGAVVSLLPLRDVSVEYGAGRRAITAVDNVSLDLPAGAVVGLVGESGSGKSTLAKAIVGLVELSGGAITLDGETISGPGRDDQRAPAACADGVPGPVLLARSADDDRRLDDRGAHRPPPAQRRRMRGRRSSGCSNSSPSIRRSRRRCPANSPEDSCNGCRSPAPSPPIHGC